MGESDGPGPKVIEDDVVKKRLRRPWDIVRFLLALILIGVVLSAAYVATATTAGIGKDVQSVSSDLPDFVVYILDLVGLAGLLLLPASAAIYLFSHSRRRQLLEATIALVVATTVLLIASFAILHLGSDRFIAMLAEPNEAVQAPLVPLLGGLLAFVTTARLMSRSVWAAASILVIAALIMLTILAGATTITGTVCSALAGWAIGLGTRYAFGTPTTRPTGQQVATALAKAGYPVTVLQAQSVTEIGRRYGATQADGTELEVFVLDRDLEGAGLGKAAWASLRLRESGRRVFNLRKTVDHRALMAYAAQVRNVPAAELLAVREINPDSSLLAYANIEGQALGEMDPGEVTDHLLDEMWQAVEAMRDAGIAHRRLNANNITITNDGHVRLFGIGHGDVAAGDLALRIDLAEMLCTQALIVGKERALAAAQRTIGIETLMTALPALQPVALSQTTRKALRKQKGLLVELRDALTEINPDAEVETIELERIKPKTIIMALVGTVAAYFVILQLTRMLSGVDLGEIIATANWWWVLIGLGASIVTYPAAAWQLSGFVPEKLKLFPTTMTQLAGDFITLITPPTLGAVAINLRYLQKKGIHPALATASIGVSQVGAFAVHSLLLLGFGIAAGSQQDFSLHVPTFVFLLVGGVFLVAAALLALQPTRRIIWKRIGPLLKQVGPRLLTVAQTPMKLVEGFGGMLLLNLGYIACLAACVHAFGGDVSFAAIAIVYLTGSVIGQAAPTPGGLGAVEVAMSAGLTAAGIPAGIALTSVLMFRMLTFILPTVPGWFAFNWLQKRELI